MGLMGWTDVDGLGGMVGGGVGAQGLPLAYQPEAGLAGQGRAAGSEADICNKYENICMESAHICN